MIHAYLFEARGIQRYLFSTGKLRDLLAKSELIDQLCADGGFLDKMLSALDLQPSSIPRRAGGTFYLLFAKEEEARRFRAAWRLAITQWIPGVEGVDAIASADTARNAVGDGVKRLRESRNIIEVSLPRPSPIDARSPRTGFAATSRKSGEHLDAATERARTYAGLEGSSRLEQRFFDRDGYAWPRSFEPHPGAGALFPLNKDRLVGVLHADGNGIGGVLRVLFQAASQAPDAEYVEIYRMFSDGMASATQAAACEAAELALVPHAEASVMPARPLVLGGDDITLLVRADLAVPFARRYLTAFEDRTRAVLTELKQRLRRLGLSDEAARLPDQLTASAGIVYCKSSFPFLSAYALADDLAGRAKHESRRAGGEDSEAPSTIAFQKMEGAVLEGADALHSRFHQISDDATTYHLSLPAYAVRPHPKMPDLGSLDELARPFSPPERKLNDRPLRELATLWHQDVSVARGAYARWRQLASKNHEEALAGFDAALRKLVGESATDLPTGGGDPRLSPLSDLITWLSLNRPDTQTTEAR